MIKLNFKYLSYFTILFLIVTAIAIWVKDSFIRPFFGDFLALITLYCLIRGFVNTSYLRAILTSLVVSYLIEGLQYIDFLSIVNLKENKILRIVLGTSFSWGDMVAYTFGAVLVYLVENKRQQS